MIFFTGATQGSRKTLRFDASQSQTAMYSSESRTSLPTPQSLSVQGIGAVVDKGNRGLHAYLDKKLCNIIMFHNE